MFELLDNALESAQFSQLKDELTSSMFPWYYVKDTALQTGAALENNFSFHNTVYDVDQPQYDYMGPTYNICVAALKSSLKALGYQLKELHRIRINLYTRNHETIVHHPHIDDDNRDSKIGLLYITTNFDSPTLIFNELFDLQRDINDVSNIEGRTFTIRDVVHSNENRFILFDGNRYHSSTRPVQEDLRININYNFTINDSNSKP